MATERRCYHNSVTFALLIGVLTGVAVTVGLDRFRRGILQEVVLYVEARSGEQRQ